MSILRALALTAAFTSTLSAQSFVTSPLGFEATEGNTSMNHFSAADRRFQQIDNTQQGQALLVQSLGVRRDGGTNGGGIGAGARRAELEVTMGIANFGVLSAAFDNNYLPGSRQVAYVKKPTSIPSWIGNAGAPAPFDFVMPYDAPYAYGGRNALIIDFTHENLVFVSGTGNTGGSNVDRQMGDAEFGFGFALSTGCTVTGMSQSFVHSTRYENNGPAMPRHGMRIRYSVGGAPVNAPVFMNLDFSNANLNIPGLCTTLNALPTISILAGIATSTGGIETTSVSFAYDPALAGATLITQMLALDAGRPGIPIALSNGRQSFMPADPTTTGAQECAYGWSLLPANSGTLFFGGGLVLQLEY